MEDLDITSAITDFIPKAMTLEALSLGDTDFTEEFDNMAAAVQDLAFENDIDVQAALAFLSDQVEAILEAGEDNPYALLLKELVQIVSERLTEY